MIVNAFQIVFLRSISYILVGYDYIHGFFLVVVTL